MRSVYVIWAIGLAVTLAVFVPLSVVLLHRLWRAARSIQLYARDSLTAAGGIAGNTAQIPALDKTIEIAGSMLGAASAIEQKLGAATGLLARRAGRS
ncbi:MAG: hypothetical protein ABIQ52_00575 [Vicinamibacterales bacterium]